MTPAILFRRGAGFEDDAEIMALLKSPIPYFYQRTNVPQDSLVVGRYSVLPYYRELWNDLVTNGSRLINSPEQHAFVASASAYAEVLKELTPETWTRLVDVPDSAYPIVIKGETNSRKDRWDTHMFARTREDATQVMLRLHEDGLIGSQPLVFRKYYPLAPLGTGIGGMPISHEYRFFVLDGEIIASGFYWSSHAEEYPAAVSLADWSRRTYDSMLTQAIDRIGDRCRFYAIDIAMTETDHPISPYSGKPIVIELNDGQMSGLACCSAEELYKGIARVLAASP